MNTQQLREKYYELYEYMAQSKEQRNMKSFGIVMNSMMEWMIANKPYEAEEWIMRLEAIKWKNYLTPMEANAIVENMNPKAPWSREQWKQEMERYAFEVERWNSYNRCALYVTMSMIMSDSSNTLAKFIDSDNIFKAVYELAVDKLTDKDERFNIRAYFEV